MPWRVRANPGLKISERGKGVSTAGMANARLKTKELRRLAREVWPCARLENRIIPVLTMKMVASCVFAAHRRPARKFHQVAVQRCRVDAEYSTGRFRPRALGTGIRSNRPTSYSIGHQGHLSLVPPKPLARYGRGRGVFARAPLQHPGGALALRDNLVSSHICG